MAVYCLQAHHLIFTVARQTLEHGRMRSTMTATIDSVRTTVDAEKTSTPTSPTQQRCSRNAFALSLEIGFFLSDSDTAKVVEIFRATTVVGRYEIAFPPKSFPNIPKGTPKDVANAERARADAENAARRAKVESFFLDLLRGHQEAPEIASLLANKVKSSVSSFVARETAGDNYWTLLAEHD